MTRRDFVEDTAVGGIAFVACGLQGGVGGAQTQTRRREGVVNGKRVKTVDIHAHCAVPEAMALMNLKVTGQPNLPNVLVMTQPADRLRAMDEQGIDMEALSINPYWYKADREVAQKIISIQNEKLAEAKYHPFWAKAEQLGGLIFIHPQGTAEMNATTRFKGNGLLDNVIGNPL